MYEQKDRQIDFQKGNTVFNQSTFPERYPPEIADLLNGLKNGTAKRPYFWKGATWGGGGSWPEVATAATSTKINHGVKTGFKKDHPSEYLKVKIDGTDTKR